MSNDIRDLQDPLFDTLRALKNKDDPMDLDRAKSISEVAQVIINGAKAEIDFAKVTGSVDSLFFTKANYSNSKLESHATPTGKLTTEYGPTGLRVVKHELK